LSSLALGRFKRVKQLERLCDRKLFKLLLVSFSKRDGVRFDLSGTNDGRVVEAFDLGVSDFSVELVLAVVDRYGVAFQEKAVVDLFAELLGLGAFGDDLDLSRGDPEVPLASSVLAENGDESFEGSENGSMNDDGSFEAVL